MKPVIIIFCLLIAAGLDNAFKVVDYGTTLHPFIFNEGQSIDIQYHIMYISEYVKYILYILAVFLMAKMLGRNGKTLALVALAFMSWRVWDLVNYLLTYNELFWLWSMVAKLIIAGYVLLNHERIWKEEYT